VVQTEGNFHDYVAEVSSVNVSVVNDGR